MKLGEAFVALGFDVDDDKLKSFQDRIDTLETSMFKVSGVTAAALYGIDKFIDSVTRGAIALRDMSIQTGLSQQELQQWSIAAHMSDTAFSIDAALSSLQNLQSKLSQLRQGQGNARPFSLLLNADARGMSAFEVMRRLREQLPYDLQRFGSAGVANLMQEAGVDPHFLNLLEQTGNQFGKTMQAAQQFMMTAQQNKNLDALGYTLDQLDLKFEKFKKTLGAQYAPILIQAMEALPGIIGNIGTALDKIGEPLAIVLGIAAVVLSPWVQLAAVLGGVLYTLNEIGGVMSGQDNTLSRLIKNPKAISNHLQTHILDPIERIIGSQYFPNLPENAGKNMGHTIGDAITGLVDRLISSSPAKDLGHPISHTNSHDTTINIHGSIKEAVQAVHETFGPSQTKRVVSRSNGGGQ